MGEIRNAFIAEPNLSNLLVSDWFAKEISKCLNGWRQTVAQAALLGIPTPAFSSALSFYDGMRCSRLPANLIQVYTQLLFRIISIDVVKWLKEFVFSGI